MFRVLRCSAWGDLRTRGHSRRHILQDRHCTDQLQQRLWDYEPADKIIAHKKICSSIAANTASSASSSTPDPTSSGYNNLQEPLDRPLDALISRTWLHNRPEADVFALLIDTHRLRMDDDYKLTGDVEEDSLYDGGDPRPGFIRFLAQAACKPNLLPDWWSTEKAHECIRFGSVEGWSNLISAMESEDIREHYGNPTMLMQMRMFGEQVIGTAPGG